MYPRLRDLRNDKQWTQAAVAKMLGMSQTGYSKYETGENDIPTAVLLQLADIYHTRYEHGLSARPHQQPRAARLVMGGGHGSTKA